MSQYEQYAHVYDASGQKRFSTRMLGYLAELIRRHPVPVKSMVDLACGTGTVAIGMAEQGWQVEGVDLSKQMLSVARSKPGADAVLWRQQDMRKLTLDRPVALVTCLYDSMNYMLCDSDLAQVFRSVYYSLLPDGLFIFDMNTYEHLSSVDQQSFVTESDDTTVIMACSFDERLLRTTISMTCFERQGDIYRRFDEVHVEQAFPPEHVATLLADAHLSLEGLYACFTLDSADDETERAVFVARRRA